MDKPIHIGHSVLDIDKILICEFHQDNIVPKLVKNNVQVNNMNDEFYSINKNRLFLCRYSRLS